MPLLDPPFVRQALTQLSNRNRSVFGADYHRFQLNPALSESEISAFEKSHSISLPPDYRHFLATIGNGGAGPYYGLFRLGEMDDGLGTRTWCEGDGLVGILSAAFSLKEKWNDLSGSPSEDLLKTDPEEYDRQLEAFDNSYFGSELLNGAMPICHMGCALRVWLIVTGDSAGRLWRDGRAEQSGLSPIFFQDHQPATFSSWYREWLRDPEQMK